MNCRKLAELLIDYIAGELSAAEAESVRGHLEGCPTCVCYVETYQLTITLTRRLPAVAPPPALLERLRAAVQQDKQ